MQRRDTRVDTRTHTEVSQLNIGLELPAVHDVTEYNRAEIMWETEKKN
jgi:hypothetical protein